MSDTSRFGALFSSFWTGDTGKQLRRDPDAQRVALYLLSAPGSNPIGLYYLPLPTLAHEVGLPSEGASKALRRLSALGFAHYDDGADMVWVVEMARFRFLESRRHPEAPLKADDHKVAFIQRLYDEAPKCAFLGAFFDRYTTALHLTRRRGEAPPEPLGSPSQGPSKPPRRGSGERRTSNVEPRTSNVEPPTLNPNAPPPSSRGDDGPQAGNGLHPRRRPTPRPRPITGPLAVWFDTVFWPAYPWKLAKDDAERALAKLDPDASVQTRIMAALAWQRASGCLMPRRDRDDKPVRLYPASYLNGARWLDEPDEPPPEESVEPADAPHAIEVPEGTPGAFAYDGGWLLEVGPGDPRYPRRGGLPR